MLKIAPPLLQELHKALPRYTSYPTAADWLPSTETAYRNALSNVNQPLSLYLHIPFCQKMCLYCGCSVILNRKAEKEELYVESLIEEIKIVSSLLAGKKKVVQLHFGGGTPTQLSASLLCKLMDALHHHFSLCMDQEISIEIDPRTVYADQAAKLRLLKELGFNRISFGVQDSNERVQEAIKRRQSWQMTQETFYFAKELGFSKINLDLIYGLPLQTKETFQETTEKIIELRPDRIALFSYAKVPWLKPHQKAIQEKDLPSTEEKFTIYAAAREHFIQSGYLAIGMDHFALSHDELALAYHQKTLGRNFQGYSTTKAEEMLSFGTSAISSLKASYFQNHKDLEKYQSALKKGCLPIERGFILGQEDLLRRQMIQQLMCQFHLKKERAFIPFIAEKEKEIEECKEKGLLIEGEDEFMVTPLGELFVRNIATLFDRYRVGQGGFSKSI